MMCSDITEYCVIQYFNIKDIFGVSSITDNFMQKRSKDPPWWASWPLGPEDQNEEKIAKNKGN